MTVQSIKVNGRRVQFEWHCDPIGDGGQVEGLPGAIGFHADSLDDARDAVRSLYTTAHE